jgi:predicted TIM-barrel fold metal-dependent hydrolase
MPPFSQSEVFPLSYAIFAHHAHISPKEMKPSGTLDALLEMLYACEIDGAVCFAPFPDVFALLGQKMNQNQWLAQTLDGRESLVGFGTVDFTRDDLADQVNEIAALGFKGIKIHPAAQGIPVLGDKAREVYVKAQELRLFVSFHTGIHWHRISTYRPVQFDELNWDYPRLRFSMEHMGGYHFFREALAVLCNGNNGYGGWTSIDAGMPLHEDDTRAAAGPWTLTDEELVAAVTQAGSNRHIFGLDFPFKSISYVRRSIERFSALPIPDEAKEGLFAVNLMEALRL